MLSDRRVVGVVTVSDHPYRALMGKNNKARRAAKARHKAQAKAKAREKAQRRERSVGDRTRGGVGGTGGRGGNRGSGQHGSSRTGDVFAEAFEADPTGWTYDRLMDAAGFQYRHKRNLAYNTDLHSATFNLLGRVPFDVLATAAERVLLSRLGAVWNDGWLPAELQRQARLDGTRAITARLMSEAIANDDARRRAASLDARWTAHVAAMGLPPADGKPGWFRRWVRAEQLDPADARDALVDTVAVTFVPTIDFLIPPPGSQGTAGTTRSGRDAESAERDPLLVRIRALLAKAESTDFEEEAMAFTAKAQELITRHAIDVALLVDGDGPGDEDPDIIRVPIDPPYWDAKGLMLQIVAGHTRCRSVMMTGLHMSRVIGYPADLTAVEMLFTSLLIQAQTALAQAGRAAPPGTRTRSSAYRSSFLVAYANRIGDRLAEINAAVTAEVSEQQGDGFLPVLRAQEDRIDDFMTERFGEPTTSGVRGGYDPAAAAHGRQAANAAQLSFGDVEGDGSSNSNPGSATDT